MADLSPTWEAIANKWADSLRKALGWTVYYPYPENAVDRQELPALIINEPTGEGFAPFSFAATTVSYSGDLSLLVMEIDTGQARLKAGDINQITALGLQLNLAVHRNRTLKGFFSNASLGEAKIARLSPYDDDTRGHYAGLSIPYTIQMHYGSNS